MLVSVKTGPEGSDEELLLALASGDDRALGPLYRRYVPMVFRIAAQSLGRDSAEDIVQEVFASVWKNAATFDPERGPVRPWILQIARSRVLNELRRRSRKPESDEERDASELQELPDGTKSPDQAVWEEYRRSAIQKAIGSLKPSQRQALSLACILRGPDARAGRRDPQGSPWNDENPDPFGNPATSSCARGDGRSPSRCGGDAIWVPVQLGASAGDAERSGSADGDQ